MSFEEIVYRRMDARQTKCDHKSSHCHYVTGELIKWLHDIEILVFCPVFFLKMSPFRTSELQHPQGAN